MARLIDADKLIEWSQRNLDGGDELIVMHAVDRQPEYNPWRKIDDVDGLVDGQEVIFILNDKKWAGEYSKEDDLYLFGEFVSPFGNTSIATHYMLIPDPPKVEE